MKASFARFQTAWAAGESAAGLSGKGGVIVERSVGPIETTIAFFQQDQVDAVLLMAHLSGFGLTGVTMLRAAISEATGVPAARVFLFASHNHCAPALEPTFRRPWKEHEPPDEELTPRGADYLEQVTSACRDLRSNAVHVRVRYAVGREGSITYNRKAYRADGSSYFMREEDRLEVGEDYRGDIDTEAPILVFEDSDGHAVGAILQFTGHPVTAYHPERFVVFGEWPQVAAERVRASLGGVPVGFLQGCSGDINSKEFLSGRIERSLEFGSRLAEAYRKALSDRESESAAGTTASETAGADPETLTALGVSVSTAAVPCRPLPAVGELERELAEIDDFIRRAEAGDPQTYQCVGLNFPRALSPAYRGLLVKAVRPWTVWALEQRRSGRATRESVEIPIAAIRLGPAAIVGFACEPFSAIGRMLRQRSSAPITIAAGYLDASYGYVPNSGNVWGTEYMSSFYRYTRFWPPFAPPAGDVLADQAVEMVERFYVT